MEIKRQQWKCLRCGWLWMGRKKNDVYGVPTYCPHCRSPYWNKVKYLFKKTDKEYQSNKKCDIIKTNGSATK